MVCTSGTGLRGQRSDTPEEEEKPSAVDMRQRTEVFAITCTRRKAFWKESSREEDRAVIICTTPKYCFSRGKFLLNLARQRA